MWRYHLVDTNTGEKQIEVFPAPGERWGRMVSDQGAGRHLFPLSGSGISKSDWKAATQHWSRTLVVSWNETAKYAGVILDRTHKRKKNALEVLHKDIRVFLGRRFFHDVNGYQPKIKDEHLNQSLRGLAAATVRRAMVTQLPGGLWQLPVVIPGPEAGPFSRTYRGYEFTTAESMLDEIERLEYGPDVDFEPRWSPTTGRLEWLMRIGTPRLQDTQSYEFPVNVPEPKVFDLDNHEDGTQMLTGLLAIGKGAEEDIRVGKGESLPGPQIPFLDSSESFKEIDDVAALNMHARGEVRARRNATQQWELKIRTDSLDVSTLRLGSTIRLKFQNDEWEDDGAIDMYVIAYYGDGTDTITFDVQDPRRVA